MDIKEDINKQKINIMVAVLGGICVGKTSIIDKMCQSQTRENEIGGMTQRNNLMSWNVSYQNMSLPKITFIDTPGLDHFNHSRIMAIKSCHVGLVVIDAMFGIDNRTIEFINQLREHRKHFAIILNKLDRIHGWTFYCSRKSDLILSKQSELVRIKIDQLMAQVENQMRMIGILATDFRKMNNYGINQVVDNVPIIPMANAFFGYTYLSELMGIYCKHMENMQFSFNNCLMPTTKEMVDDVIKYVDQNNKLMADVILCCQNYEDVINIVNYLKMEKMPINKYYVQNELTLVNMIFINSQKISTVLAFGLNVDDDVQQYADRHNIKIIKADIVFQLTNDLGNYLGIRNNEKQFLHADDTIWPCILRVHYVLEPNMIEVELIDGELYPGTPLCTDNGENIGHIISVNKALEKNVILMDRKLDTQKIQKGDFLYSMITRQSIDVMKKYFMKDLIRNLECFNKLKTHFNIV